MLNVQSGMEKGKKVVNFLAGLTDDKIVNYAKLNLELAKAAFGNYKLPEGYGEDQATPNNQTLNEDPAKEALEGFGVDTDMFRQGIEHITPVATASSLSHFTRNVELHKDFKGEGVLTKKDLAEIRDILISNER